MHHYPEDQIQPQKRSSYYLIKWFYLPNITTMLGAKYDLYRRRVCSENRDVTFIIIYSHVFVSIFVVYGYLCPFYILFTKELPFCATCCVDSERLLCRWEMGRKELCDLQQSCINIIIHFFQRMVILHTVRPLNVMSCYVMLSVSISRKDRLSMLRELSCVCVCVCVSVCLCLEGIYNFLSIGMVTSTSSPSNYNSNFLPTTYWNRFGQCRSPTV
jgi:hypothetical protein